MTVVLNDFIASRGLSGSSRGARLISGALDEEFSLDVATPRKVPKGRVARLLHMLWWDFISVPLDARKANAPILIHATNTGGKLPGQKSVVVMHDTMVLDHPSMFDKGFRRYAFPAFGLSTRIADVIVTPSAHSRLQILRRWPGADVRVINWPAPTPVEDATRHVPLNRILVVASADKHKRIPMAIEVVRLLRERTSIEFELDLLMRAGNAQEEIGAAMRAVDPLSSWIHCYEGVSDSDLERMYRTSFALIVSSIDEGYCLPAVEAAARGLPVAHTGRASLPEVTVGLVVPSEDPQLEIEQLFAQCQALLNHDVREEQVLAGLKLAEYLSFERFRNEWVALVRSLQN